MFTVSINQGTVLAIVASYVESIETIDGAPDECIITMASGKRHHVLLASRVAAQKVVEHMQNPSRS